MNKFIKPILCLISLFLSVQGMSQKKKYTLEDLSLMNRDTIVALAESYIQAKDFDRKNFDVVKIRKTSKIDDVHYYVTFKPAVIFFSGRYAFYSSVTVDLVTGSTSNSIEEKGKRCKGECSYYSQSKEARKAIRFISKAAEKAGGVIRPDKAGNVYAIEIYERALYYHVDINSSSTYGYYRVNKLTGKVYHQGHKHKIVYRGEDNE